MVRAEEKEKKRDWSGGKPRKEGLERRKNKKSEVRVEENEE